MLRRSLFGFFNQLSFTRLRIEQLNLTFNPDQFEVVQTNELTTVNLKTQQSSIYSELVFQGGMSWTCPRLPLIVFRNGLAQTSGFDFNWSNGVLTFLPTTQASSMDKVTALN